MARKNIVIVAGRLLFFVLMIMQGLSLAAYLAEYQHQAAWYSVSLLLAPASLFWWYISVNDAGKLTYLFFAWLSYVLFGFVPLIGIVFGLAVDKIESDGFLNPSTLKMTLCITPLLLLLMFHTGMELKEHRQAIINFSFKAAIDLLDGIELLAIVLEENVNESSSGVSKSFQNALISFACIVILCQSLLSTPYNEERLENRGEGKTDSITQALLNTVLLSLRLGLIFGYGRIASLFITKNIIMIFVRLFEMECIYRRLGLEDEPQMNEPQNYPEQVEMPP